MLAAVFTIATCGLVYELVAGTQASYLLGDSVTQFSTIIGVYLFSMGIGSFLSRYFHKNLLTWFIRIELLVGLVGGFSSVALFLLFPLVESFRLVLYALVALTGILVGLEIPLLMRMLKDQVEFSDLVSKVFTFDYIGALLASLIFPLVLVPYLGLIRTSLFFGILNIAVAFYLTWIFGKELKRVGFLRGVSVALILLELIAFVMADQIMDFSEHLQFNDKVVYATSTPYQRIVITNNKRETRLFLNGNLQFSTADEYRYHEALVHPMMSSLQAPADVLILGGGDGLAVREILKYPSVKSITLVDLDPMITRLFSTQEMLTKLNGASLSNSKVKIVNQDAFAWIRKNEQQYDAVVIDFPDPSNFSIGKLYSLSFYRELQRALKPLGMAVIQSTSPYVAPKSFWCIHETVKAAGFMAKGYHNMVPSFGEWGYILAYKEEPKQWFEQLPVKLRYLDKSVAEQMFVFPKDMTVSAVMPINRLNNQSLVHFFEEEWSHYQDQ